MKQMIGETDVVFENFRPGRMDELGLDGEVVKAVNPKIIMASVSGYHLTGPSRRRAGYEAIALAKAGLFHITGQPDGPPAKPGIAIRDLCTGFICIERSSRRWSPGEAHELDVSLA